MAEPFNFARLDELIGRRLRLSRHEAHRGELGQIIDVTTTIPVHLREMLMEEGITLDKFKREYGRRVHLNVKLDRGDEVLVSWDDVDLLD